MNIRFYGQSAVATLYGWALAQAGHRVEFWRRPQEDFAHIAASPLRILDARVHPKGTAVSAEWSPAVQPEFPANHGCDLVVVAVRHDRLAAALRELKPVLGDATVLIFGNVWEVPSALLRVLPGHQIAWAYPSAGGSADDEGTFSGALLAAIHVGTVEADVAPRERVIWELFRDAGFRVEEHKDFRGWLWLQFVVGAGLAVQSLEAGSVEQLMASPVHLKKAILNIRELLPLVVARGVDLRNFASETTPFRFPAWLGGLILQTTLHSHEAVRAIWEAGDDEERRLMGREVLSEARRLGVSVPRLEALEPLFQSGTELKPF